MFRRDQAYFIETETIAEPVDVMPWQELHTLADHVGDKFFFRDSNSSQECGVIGCSDTRLGSNAPYVVCPNNDCMQVCHASCLSASGLAYRPEGIFALESTSVLCPKCSTRFQGRHNFPEQNAGVRVVVDIGTTRIKAEITSGAGKTHPLLDNPGKPEPMVGFGTAENRDIYFEERARSSGSRIKPIKDLICGFVEPPFDISASEVLKAFLNRVTSTLLNTLADSNNISDVLLAVAVPAGLSLELQSRMLNAAVQCGVDLRKKVIPILLNEAKMAYLDGRELESASTSDHLALALDMGGFTTVSFLVSTHFKSVSDILQDLALVLNAPSSTYPDVTVTRTTSLKFGSEWIKRGLVTAIKTPT